MICLSYLYVHMLIIPICDPGDNLTHLDQTGKHQEPKSCMWNMRGKHSGTMQSAQIKCLIPSKLYIYIQSHMITGVRKNRELNLSCSVRPAWGDIRLSKLAIK